jgi:4'-phosphopantetheinyl transferase
MAAQALGLSDDAVQIARGGNGKPLIAAPTGSLSVNWSHRPGLMLIGLAEGQIGVDVELLPGDDPLPLARDHFAAAEAAWLASLPAEGRPRAFTLLWTAKEALLKATGQGIASGLAQPDLSALLPLGGTARLAFAGQDFSLYWFDLGTAIGCRAVAPRPAQVTFPCFPGAGPETASLSGSPGVME